MAGRAAVGAERGGLTGFGLPDEGAVERDPPAADGLPPIGKTRDSIVVPAGFVTDFASIPRSLWTELSPVGDHQRAAIAHDYLYWFQPCEREEADNLLMIAMTEAGVLDLQ